MTNASPKGLLIKGGTVVDGTGAEGFAADVRLKDGVIAEIGEKLEQAAGEEIYDATGCYVTPGFIESHTHYDAVMWWQPNLDPLPGYGVTTTIMGNCGFSVAPISDDEAARKEVVKIFSFFEDIPEGPFFENVPWDWHSWSEYAESLQAKVKIPTNYGAFVGHIAIRLAVLGMDAWERAATADEIEKMVAMLDDALSAGALGMSSNLMDHDGNDRPVPTMHADDAEFRALLEVLATYPGTSLQVIVDTFMRMTAPDSTARIARLAEGLPVRVQWAGLPTLEFQKFIQAPLVEMHEQFKKDGRDFWTAYAHVSPSNSISVNNSLIFAQTNDYVWHEVVTAETEAEKLRILKDPDWRARARHSWDNEAIEHSPFANARTLNLLNSDNGVGPVKVTLGDYADELGLHCSDAMAEWLIANGLESTVHMPPFPKDNDMVLKLLRDPNSVGNVSDAGAHGQMLCGAGENILLFTKFVRETGELTVEEAVYVQTGKLAKYLSLSDRGELKVGKRGDVCVFNLDEVQYQDIDKVYDVPDGKGGTTWRWTRKPAPVRLTLVNGVATFADGKSTGAVPGQMISPNEFRAAAE